MEITKLFRFRLHGFTKNDKFIRKSAYSQVLKAGSSGKLVKSFGKIKF